MLVIATFMFEPAKLAMNCVRASGISSCRGETPEPCTAAPGVTPPEFSATERWRFGRRDCARRDDQREVAERLWEVSACRLCATSYTSENRPRSLLRSSSLLEQLASSSSRPSRSDAMVLTRFG